MLHQWRKQWKVQMAGLPPIRMELRAVRSGRQRPLMSPWFHRIPWHSGIKKSARQRSLVLRWLWRAESWIRQPMQKCRQLQPCQDTSLWHGRIRQERFIPTRLWSVRLQNCMRYSGRRPIYPRMEISLQPTISRSIWIRSKKEHLIRRKQSSVPKQKRMMQRVRMSRTSFLWKE